MSMRSLKASAFAAVAVTCFVFGSTAAVRADNLNLAVTGTLEGQSYSGVFNLDYTGGIANSGTGTLSIFGLVNAPVLLITSTTPGNDPNPGGAMYPVTFRANDGTDLIGADQRYPLDIGGLLFQVGSTTPSAGNYPLFNLFLDSDNVTKVAFAGVVNGEEHYDVYPGQFGTANVVATITPVTAVPGPVAGAGISALLTIGGMVWARRRKAV